MNNTTQFQLAKYGGLIVIFAISFLIAYSGFKAAADPLNNSGDVYDPLSGQTFDTTLLRDDVGPNPNMPWFIGFSELIDSGATSDDIGYIQDYLANYTLYDRHVDSARISFVSNSFTNPHLVGTASTYEFQFGINGGDVHTVKVASDIVTQKITITIVGNNGQPDQTKTFDVYRR
ncbi:MAG TPA: hypothetical protein VFK03_02745 [Candidatus Saccharimonadales bacterium]|nr:hypothetical protein [Candidatus Saccharimonadales bacterium]